MKKTIFPTNLLLIAVADLCPRKINPNRMSAADFAAYKREVERLGKPPKPIIVRKLKNGKYEIVDGEHAWRCANELGFESVLCEVRELNDFEAALECFKRNRGGKDNPVVLGRMFREMMQTRNLSIRALAKELGISEGKVRIYLDYLAAYEMRIKYAPETAEDDISRLTQAQLRKYLSMPSAIGDRWLDAGADPTVFEGFGEWQPDRVPCEINRFKLTEHIDTNPKHFGDSVSRLADLAMWLDKNKHIKDVKAYAAAVAKLGLPAEVMDFLPIGTECDQTVVRIEAEAWADLLAKASEKSSKRSGLIAEIEAGVRLALRDAGIDPAVVCSRADAEALCIVADAPECIQQADHLILREKRWLAEIPIPEGDETIPLALQMTCDLLRDSRGEKGSRKKSQLSDSVSDVFRACLVQIERNHQDELMNELFADTDLVAEKMMEILGHTAAIRDGVFGEQPASEVLAERLSCLELPERRLIASLVLQPGAIEDATARWLQGFDWSDSTEDVA